MRTNALVDAAAVGKSAFGPITDILACDPSRPVYDGELMIEMQPGEFVNETAVRRGLVHSNVLTDIHRIKGRLRRTPQRLPKNPKPRQQDWRG